MFNIRCQSTRRCLAFVLCGAVSGRAHRSRSVSSTAVQRFNRKRRIRCRSSRDRLQEREQECVRPVGGVGQDAAVVVARSRVRQRHDRLRHRRSINQSTFTLLSK